MSINSKPQYILYCRKSSESEERQILSIESQIKELKDLANSRGYTISQILTESQSAKYPGRPVFGKLMELIYEGKIKGVISWKLDRLARNPIDGASLIWSLDRGMIDEIITPHGMFVNNSNDKFLMQIEFGMAKKYVDDLSDNVKRGNRAKLEKGWLPGLAPLGYLNEPRERTIIKDPDRFELVRKMWELLFQGISVPKILSIANNEWGLRSRKFKRIGGNPISLSKLYKLFRNPFYYGFIERKEGVYIGKHEAMITENEFWKAQEILGNNGKQRPKTRTFAYTGLIRCDECGCSITAEEKVNRYGSHYIYYHCTKKKPGICCHQSSINVLDLEKEIKQKYLRRIHLKKTYLKIALIFLEYEIKNDSKSESQIKDSQKSALKLCSSKLNNLLQLKIRNLISDEEFIGEKKKLLNEKLGLENSLLNHNAEKENYDFLTRKVLEFAHSALKTFSNASPYEKREILKELGSNFLLNDKKLYMDLKKPFHMIQKAITSIGDKTGGLEPSINRINTTNIKHLPPQFAYLQTLVHDVRTFYREEVKHIND